jgi:CDP-glucose 4,6-dehydratase
VLFTGAQGFIGSWVTERLLDAGAEVFVLARRVREGSYFDARGLGARCTPIDAQLADVQSLREALDAHEVQAVFHLAAAAIVGTATSSPLKTYEVNVQGTWNLLEACRTAKCTPARIVVASTDKAYGVHEQLPYREGHALLARYPYDVSKACADMIARSYAHTFALPVAVTRFANVFGGGDANFSRLIPGTIRALLAGERPAIRSNGLMQRDFLYAPDAASAYLAVAESLTDPAMYGRAWNAGLGEPVTVLEVVQRLTDIAGAALEPDVQGDGTPHGELPRQWLDCGAIAGELNWRPAWDLQSGLEATYGWYAQRAQPARRAHPPRHAAQTSAAADRVDPVRAAP